MFQDKVCVITGGALGIGRCLTREFSKAGAIIAFIDKNEQAGKENEEFLKKNREGFFEGVDKNEEFSSVLG